MLCWCVGGNLKFPLLCLFQFLTKVKSTFSPVQCTLYIHVQSKNEFFNCVQGFFLILGICKVQNKKNLKKLNIKKLILNFFNPKCIKRHFS